MIGAGEVYVLDRVGHGSLSNVSLVWCSFWKELRRAFAIDTVSKKHNMKL